MELQTESKLGKKPNQKRHQKKVNLSKAPTLTPEEAAAIKAAQEKAEADRKAEIERIQNWEKRVPKMTNRQLRGEMRRLSRKEYVKVGKGVYEPQAGLTLAFLTVLDTVLVNTKTDENPFAKLSSYPL